MCPVNAFSVATSTSVANFTTYFFSNTSPSAQPNHSSLSVLSSVCHHFPRSLHTRIKQRRGLVMTIIECWSLAQNVIWSEKMFISGSHPSPYKPVL